MTDIPNTAPVVPLTADEEAQYAALQARRAAVQQAQLETANSAVKTLVTGSIFKAAHIAFDEAHQIARKDTELAYAVEMMDRLAKRFLA